MNDILTKISDCIVNMEERNIENLIIEALNCDDINIDDIYNKGLNFGMNKAIELFENKKYYIPEVIVCADTLNKGLEVLRRYGKINKKSKGKVVFAVVKGDTHEIGKNIVKIMLEASGYEVIDLGVNIDNEDIIEVAIKEEAQVIGVSSMMTTTMTQMKKLIEKLNSIDVQKKPYVIIGGGCITQNYAIEIGADGYSENAPKAVKLVDKLIGGL
ncbi:cobalamin B12-binding domain-containing protein [Tepidibacter sp. Z1-5]|uniref:cobalamin B12-binding domain-containing protein n=1 Tax=Tepidibacter sp. Z1-5 TaxID=3134138 RepID=UPI0030C3A49B